MNEELTTEQCKNEQDNTTSQACSQDNAAQEEGHHPSEPALVQEGLRSGPEVRQRHSNSPRTARCSDILRGSSTAVFYDTTEEGAKEVDR